MGDPAARAAAALAGQLRAAGCVFAEEEAELLLAAAPATRALRELVARRVAGEPLEHILGWAEFAGLRVVVTSGVFVPRRRSEYLLEKSLDHFPAHGTGIELCCGSGALSMALLARVGPRARWFAGDLDPRAVACAKVNLGNLARVWQGDLFAGLPTELRGAVDLIVANAPYVPTPELPLLPREARHHEPLGALDGGPDGLDVQRRIAGAAPSWLAPGGHLLLETSSRQARGSLALLRTAGLVARLAFAPSLSATVVIGQQPRPEPVPAEPARRKSVVERRGHLQALDVGAQTPQVAHEAGVTAFDVVDVVHGRVSLSH